MNDDDIQINLDSAISNLLSNEQWLIRNDLNEQSITHKLALYIADYFPGYDIDCEYNGNIESQDGKKRINVLRDELERHNILRKAELELETEIINRAVYPDIIIHKRGRNDFNLCIIEVKKSTSRVRRDYDYMKLRAYTTEYYGNELKYQLGIFIMFNMRQKHGYELTIFSNGQEIANRQQR